MGLKPGPLPVKRRYPAPPLAPHIEPDLGGIYSKIEAERDEWKERALIAEEAPWNLGRISVDHDQWLKQLQDFKRLKIHKRLWMLAAFINTLMLLSHVFTCHMPHEQVKQDDEDRIYRINRSSFTGGVPGSTTWSFSLAK